MNIAYLSDYPELSLAKWSGLEFYIAGALERQQAQIDFIGSDRADGDYPFLNKVKQKAYRIAGKRFLKKRTVEVVAANARQKEGLIKPATDIVFAPGTLPLAYLNTRKPRVFYVDAMFAGMVDYYEGFTNLCAESVKVGHQIEQEVVDSAAMMFFASDWAAESAVRFYNAPPEKVQVVPFGANIICNRTVADIKDVITGRLKQAVCRLLFLGVDWERKGGNTALAVVRLLNRLGINAQLHVVGVEVLPENARLPFVVNHGFVSKKTEEGRRKLDQLFCQSHFLLLPTQAECYGVAFCEASSFGLPCITTQTGGVTTVVRDGINGMTFPLSAVADLYAAYIYELFTDQKRYAALSLSAFNEYENRLNWNVAGKSIIRRLRQL